jgi:hypothetical protein
MKKPRAFRFVVGAKMSYETRCKENGAIRGQQCNTKDRRIECYRIEGHSGKHANWFMSEKTHPFYIITHVW